MNREHVRSKEEMLRFFEELAPRHDEWRARHALYYEEQTSLLRQLVEPGQRVLEVGCATGHTLAALRPSVGVGVDFSPAMLERARAAHPGLRFVLADAETLDLGGETFDVVVLPDTVGDLRDLWAAFRALRGVVHPRTRIIVTYFNYLWAPVLEAAGQLGLKRPQVLQNWFSLRDIDNLLALNGFETVTTGDRMLLPLPAPTVDASRAINRVLSSVPGVNHLNLIQYLVARPGPAFHARREDLSVSVIIPAKNERGNIRPAVARTPRMGRETEIIFVEGGSTDGTREEILQVISEAPGPNTLRFVEQPGRGKADAVRAGFAAARHDILMILDADLTVMPEDLPRFYEAIAEGRAEFVNGCRLVYQMEDQAMRRLNLVANKFFGWAFTQVLRQPIKDTLCGTKVLRRVDWERIQAHAPFVGKEDPFGDFDLLCGAAKLGMKITEMPVRYMARTYGETQIHRFRHGLMLFRMLANTERNMRTESTAG